MHVCASGWQVEERTGDVCAQLQRPTLPVEMVLARRGGEVLTATWVDGWALGPIGWPAGAQRTHPVKNAASARRCLAAEPGTC
jgi:hypothetical protein